MSACPSCKDINAYYGMFGWSCLNSNCNLFDKQAGCNITANKVSSSKKDTSELSKQSPYDGGAHFYDHKTRTKLVDNLWVFVIDNANVPYKTICRTCGETLGIHCGADGACPIDENGKRVLYPCYDYEPTRFYKHPE